MKKVLSLILVGILLIIKTNNVNASNLTLENIIECYPKTQMGTFFQQYDINVRMEADNDENKLNLYNKENEKILILDYNKEENYLEYKNTEFKEFDLETPINLLFVMQSVFLASGFDNKTIKDEYYDVNSYDEYGLLLETETKESSGTDENGGSWSETNSYVTHMKLSLDTEKITKLINEYGKDFLESEELQYLNIIPKLEAQDITENSVTLYPHVDYEGEETLFCYIYRSTSIDGVYEQISDVAVNCSNASIGFVDSGLESNTTYYYQTILTNGMFFSNPIEVKTKEKVAVAPVSKTEETVSNPKTGIFTPTNIFITFLIVGICLLKILKRKSYFSKW